MSAVNKQLSGATVGGQARCPSCRCMQTRLTSVATYAAEAFSLRTIGGCYRTNCYRPDVLQVAVLGATAGVTSSLAFWYRCPSGGGKLFIPGFVGSLTCPDPVAFCARETVSGVLFPEQNIYAVVAFYGAIGCCVFAALCVWVVRRLRNCCLARCKRCTAVSAFEVRLPPAAMERLHLALPPPPPVPLVPYRVLRYGSLLTLALGLAGLVASCVATDLAASDALTSAVALFCVVVLVGALGYNAADATVHRSPPCAVLTFFYSALVLTVVVLWLAVYAAAFESWSSLAARYYDRLQPLLKTASVCGAGCSRDELVARLGAQLQQYAAAIVTLLLLALAELIAGLASAALLIESRKTHALLSSFVVVLCWILLGFGLTALCVTFYLFSNPAVAAVAGLLGVATAAGVLFVASAALGLTGFFLRRLDLLAAFIGLLITTGVLSLAASAALFAAPSQTSAVLITLSEPDLSRVVSSLGFTLAQGDIAAAVAQKLRLLALAFALVLLVVVALLPATRILIVFMRVAWPELERQHHALRERFHIAGDDAVAEAFKVAEQREVSGQHKAVLNSEITGGIAVHRIATFFAAPGAAAARARAQAQFSGAAPRAMAQAQFSGAAARASKARRASQVEQAFDEDIGAVRVVEEDEGARRPPPPPPQMPPPAPPPPPLPPPPDMSSPPSRPPRPAAVSAWGTPKVIDL